MKKLLIVYYSWSNGNTERVAKELQSIAGGDILRIDTAVPYSGSYNDVVDQGQREVEQGFEPELKPIGVNPADYDVIAVGTPTWWYTMAPAVLTFLRGDFYKNMFAKCPAGRPGTADEVANAAELLMSDRGSFITGSTLLMDGGATASYFYGPLRPEQ